MSQVNTGNSTRLGRRILVVGTTGSGKSTLARHLAHSLHRPHIEFDALYWDPEWTPVPAQVFRERVTAALEPKVWVADGNYGAIRDITWPRADTLIWLDYPLWIILWRLSRRTLARVITREELWNGNRERLVHQFRKDSIIVWALQTYRRRRREYKQHLREPQYAYLHVVYFRWPSETRTWLARVRASEEQGEVAPTASSPGSAGRDTS